MTAIIAAGLGMGIVGSFHCVGMCGPIALALPIHSFRIWKKYAALLLYNLGRALTYSTLGLLLGLIGQSFFIGGFQQALSIIAGVLTLLFIVGHYSSLRFKGPKVITKFLNSLNSKLGRLFSKKTFTSFFGIGLLNGLLPCGLIYMAFVGALATGNYYSGALFMFAFGLGTLPAMLAVALFGQFISLNLRNHIRKGIPVMLGLVGLLLIARGLNLGIPYISPQLNKETKTANCCHDNKGAISCYAPEMK